MYDTGLSFPNSFRGDEGGVQLEDELEDEALENFIDISGFISRVGWFQPMSVNIKDGGKFLK
jgi:hypothetical protein